MMMARYRLQRRYKELSASMIEEDQYTFLTEDAIIGMRQPLRRMRRMMLV
jgi:hypothetical protein